MKKCKYKPCSKKFIPTYSSLQRCCSIPCSIELSKLENEAKREKELKKLKEFKETQIDYAKILEDLINKIVRLIDNGCACISCGNIKRAFAGHFHSVGANKSIRYNLHNIHIQDFNCNGERGGNVIAYGTGLINWYGKEYKEFVEYDLTRLYPLLKPTRNQLKDWCKIARIIIKELENANDTYAPQQRIELRNKYNKQLGIYN